uniref:Deacetylase sirtuin-type domain-containing protein n=1 Tax=Clytia hemisphaerica TaxID=252671 RepID=A0A7M5X5M1_9CNID
MMFLPTYPFKRVVSTIVAQNGLRRVKSFTGCGCRRYATAINVRNTDGFNKIADQIKRSENIVVVCGAGISTPSGLPDFRSEGTGLYDNIEDYELTTPTDVFDLRFFNHNPRPFFRLAKSLYPGNFAPNKVHYFLKLLSVKDKLRRIYTQNIDTLEAIAGVPDKEIIFAHGSFHTATCMNCSAKYKADDIKDEIMNEQIPLCRIDGCQINLAF